MTDIASAVLSILISLAVLCVLVPLVYAFTRPILSGAPFAATTKRLTDTMVGLLGDTTLPDGTRKRAADLGSGDGRIVIALARHGFEAHGFEINPVLVWYSRLLIRRARLEDRAFIHKKSYWKEDLSSFDAVTVFGITYIMNALEKKLSSELKPGARIASNHFTFPHWKPVRKTSGLFVYQKEH